ncbi:Predicted metal-dependent phosphohydrolase, HD superfamily [Catalinimonas alkaloidigena]|uniref:Predicted metal-dependent phosphohydrolase, HD superfamily n=1 Tax=Catalinimonas alkaloidigena TaxID=1075417 RepID=A0A1G8WMC6_9BACT|nr:Pycsar system effector family protein [Catalinimonas alkaloidigena]SDJ79257.1 Predicted metal-dependent phosphohydrolase, HD superfamily [Catalinimonas alkaloidigena]
MPVDEALLKRCQSFVEEYFRVHLSPKIRYHTIEHAQAVASACKDIGEHSGLSDAELEVVQLAGWLHDTGYGVNGPLNHEEESKKIASAFLTGEHYDAQRLGQVLGCIDATRMPQSPKTLAEKVVCDADLCHLASDTYFRSAKLLKQEVAAVRGQKIGKAKWLQGNQDFFNTHDFFTEYARNNLQPLKDKNLEQIQQKLRKIEQKSTKAAEPQAEVERLQKKLEKEKKKRKKLKAKSKKSTRNVDSMFRTVSKNHIDLSSIADNKANIMISVNAIIVSILVSVLLRKFEDYPNLVIPTMILIAVCLTTIVFAILATRPNVTSGRFTKEDIDQKRANLLFFGNFHKMELKDYAAGMNQVIKDDEFLYGSMIRDIYFLGNVLGQKYRRLRISYTIFMFGFIISVISFAVAVLFFPPANY